MRTEQFSKKYLAASVAAVFAVGGGVAMAATSLSISAAKTINTTTNSTGTLLNDIVLQELGDTGVSSGYVSFKIPSTVKLFESADGTAIARTTTALGSSSAPASLLVYPGGASTGAATGDNFVYVGSTTGTTAANAASGAGGVELLKVYNTYDGSNNITNTHLGTSAAGTVLELANFATLASVSNTTGADTTVVKVGQMYLDSATNDIVVTLAIKGSSSATQTATLRNLRLGATATGTNGSVAVSLVDGNPLNTSLPKIGATETSVTALTLSSSLLSLSGTAATSTVPTIAAGGAAAQPIGVMTFTVVGATTTATNDTLTITLDNGAKFHASAATTLISALTVTDSAGTTQTTAQTNLRTATAITVNSSGQLVIKTDVATTFADGDKIAIPASTALIDTSAMTAGANITASVVGSGTNFAGLSLSTAVAKVATTGTTVAYADTTSNGFSKLFSGRTVQTTDDTFSITELAPTTLLSGGTVTFSLDQSARFTASDAITTANTTVNVAAITVPSTASASITTTVSAVSTSSVGRLSFSSLDFNLVNATKGDLTLTVAGTAKAAGAVKIAEIVDATSASVGEATTGVAGNTVTLPDLTITETQVGAVSAGNLFVLAKKDQFSDFDITSATVRAFKADGTDITSSIFSSAAPTITKSTATNNTVGIYATVNAASSTSTGVAKIVIKGLKAVVASGATGDLSVVVSGAQAVTADLDVAVTGAATNEVSSNQGAKVTKATLKAATVASNAPVIPQATVTGTVTAQTIAGQVIPSASDTGVQGSIFLAAIVPVTGVGNVIVFNSEATGWVVFTDCAKAPAFNTGTLGSTKVDIVKVASDLSGLIGTQVYLGYGKGGALSPAGTACNSMLNNGTYGLIYTIK